ncbi:MULTISPECIES: LysR family transcriptional regulator [unclassified Sulfurospirillum]|uniref:LysR family transcriptional regulator n=1 Tax=unclassified Sulfurospirillum TaxID=2618290 RepID=UPI000508AE2E|nr:MULTISPECIES: LysR family transcriptional regulator [unclassified Sulfurospirillum]KFL34076.1 LysR family transcriptional regulator [Sulfurospirillum sp. SCADC]
MTFQELRLFYYLCEDSHISNLAQKLGITQSAISLAIKSLESHIGEPLFDRIGKKLVLSETGKLFREKTHAHFLALNDAEDFFRNTKVSGILNIASSKTIGDFITPQIVFDFLAQHEHVKIQKDIQNSAQIIQMVKNATIDIGFIESSCDEADLCKEVIGDDQLIVVSSDPCLAEGTFFIDELFHKKWILREKGSGTREVFLEALGEIAKDLTIFMEFSEFEEAKTILLNNPQTITCLSKVAVANELKRGELFEVTLVNLKMDRSFYLIYHKSKYQSRLFSEFKNFVHTKMNSPS